MNFEAIEMRALKPPEKDLIARCASYLPHKERDILLGDLALATVLRFSVDRS